LSQPTTTAPYSITPSLLLFGAVKGMTMVAMIVSDGVDKFLADEAIYNGGSMVG
jgi:hypothetical protein